MKTNRMLFFFAFFCFWLGFGVEIIKNVVLIQEASWDETEITFTIDTTHEILPLTVFLTAISGNAFMPNGEEYQTFETYESPSLTFAVQIINEAKFAIVGTFGDPIQLLDGFPQVFHISSDSLNLFSFDGPDDLPQDYIAISLTPISGDPKVYASTDISPTSTDHTWSLYEGSDTLMLNTQDENFPYNQTIYFSVESDGLSEFLIVCSTSHDHITLIPGTPIVDSVSPQFLANYYVVEIFEENCDMAISVNFISGDPDLFISTTNLYPNDESFQDSDIHSEHLGSDMVIFLNANATTYYIAVTAFGLETTEYSIITLLHCEHDAEENKNCPTLISGESLTDFGSEYQTRCYEFYLDGTQDVNINLEPIYGDPDLYVSTSEDPDVYKWSSQNWGGDFIHIPTTDSNFCIDCYLFIDVYAVSESAFSVIAALETSIIVLRNGIPETLLISPFEYIYTKIDVNSNHDFHVDITPISSNVDIRAYVSHTNHYPNATDYEWEINSANDGLWLDESETEDTVYYISITSDHEVRCELLAVEGVPIRLENGIPQQMESPSQKLIHYELVIDHEEQREVDFMLTILAGYADIYIGTEMIPDPQDIESYEFWDFDFVSTKEIQITAWDTACFAQQETSICHYYVTIDCLTQCEYTVIGTTERSITPLIEGQPTTRELDAGEWSYYSFDVNDDGTEISIETSVSVGSIDLYVSQNVKRPNSTENGHEWADTQNEAHVHLSDAEHGTYYIGLYSPTEFSSFILSATIIDSGLSDALQLLDGQAHDVYTSHFGESHRYYKFEILDQTDRIEINVQNWLLATHVYISNDGIMPSTNHYMWKDEHDGNSLITIDTPGAGIYYIRVDCLAICYYSITAMTLEATVQLDDGVPVTASIEQSEYNYYIFTIEKEAVEFSIDVTAISGDPDLYVSMASRPNSTHYQWRSIQYGSDALTIVNNDEHNQCGTNECTFYVGIYAYWQSRYTITASVESVISLSDGVPQYGNIGALHFQFYRIDISTDNRELTISMTITNGDADLYVKVGSIPDRDDYDHASTNWHVGESIVIGNISCSDSEYHGVCSYFIGVYASTVAEYSLLVSTQHIHQTLQDSLPIQISQESGAFSFFTYYLTHKTDMILAITQISGSPIMYISTKTQTPNAHEHDYVIEPPNALTISKNESHVGIYSIAVFSEVQTSYTISVISGINQDSGDNIPAISLISGRAQYGQITSELTYYSSTPSQEAYVSLSILSGNVEIYIKKNHAPTVDDFDVYVRSSSSTGWLEIPHDSDNSRYYIGVKSVEDNDVSDFWITIIEKDVNTQLNQGVAMMGVMKNEGEYMDYVLQVSSASRDLDIQLTAFEGSCDIYASSSHIGEATYDNHEFEATFITGGATLSIPMTTLITSEYWYISVFSHSILSRFRIMASYSEIDYLQDGVPQNDQIAPNQGSEIEFHYPHYLFRVPSSAKSFHVTVTSLSQCSNVVFYLSNTHEWNPGQEDAEWSSPIDETLQIDNTAPNWCNYCDYFATVYTTNYCSYSITYSSDQSIRQLQNGLPQQGDVFYNKYTYYTIQTAADYVSALEIMITLENAGSVTIVVDSHNQSPTLESHMWSSTSNYLYIDDHSYHFNPEISTFYIAILGTSEAQHHLSYTLTATIQNPDSIPYTTLITGNLQTTDLKDIDQMTTRYYRYSLPKDKKKMVLEVVVFAGSIDVQIADDDLIQHIIARRVIPHDPKCNDCQIDVKIFASPNSIYSLLVLEDESFTDKTKHSTPIVVWVILSILIVGLIIGFAYVFRKNRRLNYELEVAELELNMSGKTSLRQRAQPDSIDRYDKVYNPARSNNINGDVIQIENISEQQLL